MKHFSNWTSEIGVLVASKLEGEDQTKDIDFTPAGIRERWQAGYTDTKRMIVRAPWTVPVDPMDGVVIHDLATSGGRSAGGERNKGNIIR